MKLISFCFKQIEMEQEQVFIPPTVGRGQIKLIRGDRERLLPFDSFNNHFLHVLSYVILLPLEYEFAGIIYWIVL